MLTSARQGPVLKREGKRLILNSITCNVYLVIHPSAYVSSLMVKYFTRHSLFDGLTIVDQVKRTEHLPEYLTWQRLRLPCL